MDLVQKLEKCEVVSTCRPMPGQSRRITITTTKVKTLISELELGFDL